MSCADKKPCPGWEKGTHARWIPLPLAELTGFMHFGLLIVDGIEPCPPDLEVFDVTRDGDRLKLWVKADEFEPQNCRCRVPEWNVDFFTPETSGSGRTTTLRIPPPPSEN